MVLNAAWGVLSIVLILCLPKFGIVNGQFYRFLTAFVAQRVSLTSSSFEEKTVSLLLSL
jgi:hypothetical protein